MYELVLLYQIAGKLSSNVVAFNAANPEYSPRFWIVQTDTSMCSLSAFLSDVLFAKRKWFYVLIGNGGKPPRRQTWQ